MLEDNIMDLFEKFLADKNSTWVKRALTDSSYKKEFEQRNHRPFDGETNKDLSTYGDAIIKICYLDLMLDKEEKLTVEKSKVESNKFLVDKVARHYNLLKYIITDPNDKEMPRNYEYIERPKIKGQSRKQSPHKYIADAVEAVIGAIFKETNDLRGIIMLLDSWRNL